MNNDDFIHDDDDRYFYEHYEHKDYYSNMPGMHKSKRSTSAIIWILGIIIAIATWDSPAVLFFYFLIVLSGKISGAF
jgi:hypothetical protein